MDFIPWYVTLMRLVVPISILRFPLGGMLASMYADAIDWDIIGVTSKQKDLIYQNWDKALDVYALFFVVWMVRKWKDVWARRTALGFFIYRIIGVILFWVTGWRPWLFFFPNVFENFVILCLIIFWLSKKKQLYLDRIQKIMMLIVLIIPKMIQEYFQHFLGRQPWELYSIGSRLGFRGMFLTYVDPVLWVLLLYILPMGGYLLYLRKKIICSKIDPVGEQRIFSLGRQ